MGRKSIAIDPGSRGCHAIADTAGKWPRMLDVTADFVYVRLHGEVKIYASGYTGRALDQWARRIRAWDRLSGHGASPKRY